MLDGRRLHLHRMGVIGPGCSPTAMASKMNNNKSTLGSRIAEGHNGSSLCRQPMVLNWPVVAVRAECQRHFNSNGPLREREASIPAFMPLLQVPPGMVFGNA